VLYVAQCAFVLWLLWRCRRLLPELTIRFHWLAVPVGVVVFLAWIWIGLVVAEFSTVRHAGIGPFTAQLFAWMIDPASPVTLTKPDGSPFSFVDAVAAEGDMRTTMGPAVGWVSLTLRLLGMSLVVPLFEELFIRSLMLRSLSDRRNTMIGLVQVLEDLPVVGDWVAGTKIADDAAQAPPMFEREFNRVPLGYLTIFGVTASTLVFMVNHAPRDYLACIFCGVAYCLLLRLTRGKGLGPVCWAHGITNALIWLYTVHTGDWRFL
jgi:membrane protease YdiL (CAAX protease family)